MSLFSRIREFFTPTVFPSELSDPTVNKPPYGFYRGNYEALEFLSYHSGFGNPEFTAKSLVGKIKGFFCLLYEEQELTHFQYSKRLGELARMGYVDVRREKLPIGYRNHFKINPKGRKMLLKYKDFYEKERR